MKIEMGYIEKKTVCPLHEGQFTDPMTVYTLVVYNIRSARQVAEYGYFNNLEDIIIFARVHRIELAEDAPKF